jgi:hypothetical protein
MSPATTDARATAGLLRARDNAATRLAFAEKVLIEYVMALPHPDARLKNFCLDVGIAHSHLLSTVAKLNSHHRAETEQMRARIGVPSGGGAR